MILDRIVEKKQQEVLSLKQELDKSVLIRQIEGRAKKRDLALALSEEPGPNIIAEVKKASPSEGPIAEGINPADVAVAYQEGGAAAISVLTDGPFFGGSIEDLKQVKNAIDLPVLAKDFFIDEIQIYRAAAAEADAILLIAAILDDHQMQDLFTLAHELGLKALVEVHDGNELDRALRIDPAIIGINNRNLKNMTTDIATSLELAKNAASGRVLVSESGIKTHEDIKTLMNAGIKSFLVGTSLMRMDDKAAALRELITGES